jgi:integrase
MNIAGFADTSVSFASPAMTRFEHGRVNFRHVLQDTNMHLSSIPAISGGKTYPLAEIIAGFPFTWESATKGGFRLAGDVITLETKHGNGHWHYRFKTFDHDGTGSPYERGSTKTADIAAAVERAKDAYIEAKEGNGLNHATVAKVMPAFLAHLAKRLDRSENAKAKTRKHVGWFAECHADLKCHKIDQRTIDAFHDWVAARIANHRENGLMMVRPSTGESRNKQEGDVQSFLDWAAKNKHMRPFAIERSERSTGVNGIFSLADWTRLTTAMVGWEAAAHNKADQYSRLSLRAFVYVCRLAGLRVAEAYALKVGDVALYPHMQVWDRGQPVALDCVRLAVLGEIGEDGQRKGNKKGNKRIIEASADLRPLLMSLLADHPRKNDPSASLWVVANGEPISEYHHKFGELLNSLEMKRDAMGGKLVLGSFRHGFVVEARSLAIPDRFLERYCDTSSTQMREHYDNPSRPITLQVGNLTGDLLLRLAGVVVQRNGGVVSNVAQPVPAMAAE